MQDTLTAINNRLDGIEPCLDAMDTRLAGMDTRVGDIDTSMLQTSASIFNNAAIAQNNRVYTNAHTLSPLRNPVTNQAIHPFPATGDALKAPQVPQLDALIAAPGMAPIAGGLRDPKVVAIKAHIDASFCKPGYLQSGLGWYLFGVSDHMGTRTDFGVWCGWLVSR
jgi:hypothetical protein